MPYLTDTEKDAVNARRIGTAFFMPEERRAGVLTYAIYRLCYNYITSDKCFATIATVFGSIVCAGLELYRRLAAPYEDRKIRENGDVG